MRNEWIGGCLPSPFYVTDRETPYRPFMAMWAEFPSGVVLALELVPPEEADGALGPRECLDPIPSLALTRVAH